MQQRNAYQQYIQRNLSRRGFLRAGAAAVGGVALGGMGVAACGGDDDEATTAAGSDTTAAGTASTAAASSAAAADGDAIVVGSILDATGPINIYGTPMIDATAFAIDDINENGGVLGRQLQVMAIDGQSDTDVYTQAASELILNNELAVLMGGITSASREAVRPVVDREGMLYFYNEQYEGGVCDKLVFCTGVVPTQQVDTLVKWAIENVGTTFYTLAADYNYGQISADWLRVALEREGGELLGEEFIPLDVADFASSISKLQETPPAVVFSFLVGGNHIAFYRQFAAAGLGDSMQIVSATFGLGNEQVVLDPAEQENIVVAYPYFQELTTPANEEFVAKWHERFGDDYPYVTDSANLVWSSWHLWADAVDKAGALDRDTVIATLEEGASFEAPEGLITIDAPSHHAFHDINIAKTNGQQGFEILESFSQVPPAFEQSVCNLVEDPTIVTQFTPEEV